MARLTFEDKKDLATILELSKKIAAAFVRITGRRDLGGDAENDAVIALLSIEYDATNAGAKSYLKKRALGQLIRDYQNKTGQRLKNKPRFVEYVETATRATVEDDGARADEINDKTAIDKALRTFPQRDRAFLSEWITGKKQIKIAADLGLTRGRISQIISQFKSRARFFRQYDDAVVIVNPLAETLTAKERAALPLFNVL